MTNVILVAHILVSIILVIVVLMQRSEGGALGIGGGGGGGGGLMSGSGVTGALVRTTIIFGAIFFISSLKLTTMATRQNATDNDIIPADLETDRESTDSLGLDDLDDILDVSGDLLDDPLSADAANPAQDDPLALPVPEADNQTDTSSDETP